MTTRNEAIAAAEMAIKFVGEPGTRSTEARQFVDMAVALGILNLDEPKSAEKRFCEATQGLTPFQRTAAGLLSAIDAAGLRLVDK